MELLPTIPMGETRVTRLVVGGNPLRGNSHLSPERDLEMRDYYTVARVKEFLFRCEAHGINTVQARGDVLVQQCLREYWAEGGTMQFIAQTASELADLRGHVKQLAAFGVIGVYVHGSWTDRCWKAGDLDGVKDLLAVIRDSGVTVGLGAHMPEVLMRAEDEAWDLDFYMASLYNLSREDRESALVAGGHQSGERFVHEDRFAMLETIRRVERTCLAFKILGAGRLSATPEDTRDAFRVAYSGIKEKDACVVGMFPKRRDEVAENARFAREIVADLAKSPAS